MESFDYIIVGADSAGCVLANRLSATKDVRVLLVEAGPTDASWAVRMPGALRLNFLGRYNWAFHTEPEPHLNNRRLYQLRSRGLGGSFSVNGMTFVRGHRLDFDRWVTEGTQLLSTVPRRARNQRVQNPLIGR